MHFPHDGGLSCVRYYMSAKCDSLEDFACSRLAAPGKHVGRLICQCTAEDYWGVHIFSDDTHALLECTCNGNPLPVYIGAPRIPGWKVAVWPSFANGMAQCCGCGESARNRIAIAIGYPGDVPILGTIDVERAQELVVVGTCMQCDMTAVKWQLRLPQPPKIVGDEHWIRTIQGLEFGAKTRWER